jgi:hypothetical protein
MLHNIQQLQYNTAQVARFWFVVFDADIELGLRTEEIQSVCFSISMLDVQPSFHWPKVEDNVL